MNMYDKFVFDQLKIFWAAFRDYHSMKFKKAVLDTIHEIIYDMSSPTLKMA